MRPVTISSMSFDNLIEREWITVNGIGGFASSTLCGMNTRKYHGLLVAAMSPPERRMVLLSHLEETIFTPHGDFGLSNNEYPGTIFPRGFEHLRAFNVDPFPRWAYQGDGFTIEKSLRLLHGENTVCVSYSLLTGDKPITLEIRALLALRGIHELMYQWNGRLGAEQMRDGLVRIPATTRTPEVFFAHDGSFRSNPHWHLNTIYRRENERGYSGLEDLWKPGAFTWTLAPGQTVHLACSTEPVELDRVISDLDRARESLDRQTAVVTTDSQRRLEMLVRAVDSFVVGNPSDAPPEQSVKVISQYPWSPPSGRAALVGFSGFFLTTGRFDEARAMLMSLASQIRGGMVPTEYSESAGTPTYHGADVSLWFINAVGEYFSAVDDETHLNSLLGAVEEIIETYRNAASESLFRDNEGLIGVRRYSQARSWMDAQIADWIITPRWGRTVELNALWFNALMTAAALASKAGKTEAAGDWETQARKVKESFNARFWNSRLECCFDIVGDDWTDASLRPNQIFAVCLPHAVLAPERHRPVVQRIIDELLTPMGVRTLGRRDSNYHGKYAGNVVARDEAQHQGPAYPWLLGPLSTAYFKAFGRSADATEKIAQWLEPCLHYVEGDGLGQICELFGGDAPHAPGGATASGLGAAELLRVFARDVLGITTLAMRPRGSASAAKILPRVPASTRK